MIESKTNFNPTSFYDSNITCSAKKGYIIPARFYNGRLSKLRHTNKSEWNRLVMEEMRDNQPSN